MSHSKTKFGQQFVPFLLSMPVADTVPAIGSSPARAGVVEVVAVEQPKSKAMCNVGTPAEAEPPIETPAKTSKGGKPTRKPKQQPEMGTAKIQ